jgi:regulator of protease activity HflC (stomatin/prohibitin superfamily)
MLLFKYLLLTAGIGLLVAATSVIAREVLCRTSPRPKEEGAAKAEPPALAARVRLAVSLAALSLIPTLLSLSVVVVPAGSAGVRVSQFSGTKSGTLYPGAHLVNPLSDRVVLYDIRDRIFTTAGSHGAEKLSVRKTDEVRAADPFKVHSREGLGVGMAITVRYKLDPKRLDHIHANLPQPVEEELVPPVVSSVFRELVPRYTVREVFTARRDELRQIAHDQITAKLAPDGIVVKEVMIRDVQLPPEYAKGLEKLLLKDQENEGMKYDTEIKEKEVRIAELQAQAHKVRQIKQAEAEGESRVIYAKSEADAMKYTLPLKEKQIQQTRLEAEAHKEATVKNAEAAAQAKVIDSKAELERRNLLAQAEANRIRLTAAAETERMRDEAVLIKQNPLLINKIVAERLSDKIQIMMVPSDGSNFFFKDILGGAMTPTLRGGEDDDPSPAQQRTARRSPPR